ncbi:MAG TPA: hypothetical protein VJ954_03970 [Ignavibacteriaceae bacterium]|nr:hypothetical protein [Ignavibacteriaceae bacterium]
MKLLGTFIFCVIIAISCNRKEDFSRIDGYVVGFDPCSYITNHIGYVIVSDDLKDTLITYNFPDSVFTFSTSLFSNYLISGYFPSDARFFFKVKMEYRLAKGNELVYLLCPAYLNESEFNHAIQVITMSALKY